MNASGSASQLPRPKLIAVDVDNTLYRAGLINTALVDALRAWKKEGYEIFLWSMRGREYAQQIATRYDLTDLFSIICGKPGYIVDDKGLDWLRDVRILRHTSIEPSEK